MSVVAGDQPRTRSRAIRELLDHPVIDSDAHWLEAVPVLLDFVHDVGGATYADQLSNLLTHRVKGWYDHPDERDQSRRHRPGWWTWPANTVDRATAMLPGLLRKRMDSFGIDVSIVYPTLGVVLAGIPTEEVRLAAVRAYNAMAHEMFAEHGDRLLPVAVIPSFTPTEAIAELDYAVRVAGFKACLFSGAIRRPVTKSQDQSAPSMFVDNLVLDPVFDYDPLWARCAELGVAVTVHTPSMGWPDRTSTSNYVFNHLGHFAATNQLFAKALFLAGVLRRFPTLRFAFLEGGVAWACSLLSDLVSHWEKRSVPALVRNLRPSNLDTEELVRLLGLYGGKLLAPRADEMRRFLDPGRPGWSVEELTDCEQLDKLDDFAAAAVSSVDELRDLFTMRFFFGCEADDPLTALAFSPMGLGLKPLFSSDIAHFDVTDMSSVLAEGFELVEHGHLTADQFRSFTFTNAVDLHGGSNPDFFKGTVVETAVDDVLASGLVDRLDKTS